MHFLMNALVLVLVNGNNPVKKTWNIAISRTDNLCNFYGALESFSVLKKPHSSIMEKSDL